MKKIKAKDTSTCDWCRQEGKKVKAQWSHYGQKACQDHKHLIHVDDGYMTEADYQTWGRL